MDSVRSVISDAEIAYNLQLIELADPSPEPSSRNDQGSSWNQASLSTSWSVVGSPTQKRSSEVLPAPLADTDVDALCLSTSELDLKQKEGSQSRITESDNTNITFDNELFFEIECDICTELRPHTSFISTSGCQHEYCIDCCKKHAEMKISTGKAQIPCPLPDCGHSFDIDQCSDLLSKQSLEILNTRQTEFAIPSSQKVYCPFSGCSTLMENSNGISSVYKERFVECGSCHRGFCVKCNVPWHADMTCAQYRAEMGNVLENGDEKLKDLAQRQKWQVCKVCQRFIELAEGCYHMTCLCGNEFCYTCGAKWSNGRASCNCKLFDEEHIVTPRRHGPRVRPRV
ncbi:E3 ubiquitin-protein ligase RSL1 [Physcomitrium patens]|uniref:E3 ubiquitin-protein ligase RSL1 n=1 Tax=Physcomitrium patens TaxID=3218 RepID=UPI003CCCCF8D